MADRLDSLSFLHAALIGLGLAFFYYYFVYSVQNVDVVIDDLDRQITSVNTEIAKQNKLIREKQQVEAMLVNKADLIKKSREIVKADIDENTALETLTNTARELGLSIESIGTFKSWTGGGTGLEKTEIDISISGSFEQLMFLLSDLTRKESFFTFDQIQISSVSSASTKSVSDVKVTLQVVIFRESPRFMNDSEMAPNDGSNGIGVN